MHISTTITAEAVRGRLQLTRESSRSWMGDAPPAIITLTAAAEARLLELLLDRAGRKL